MRAAPGRSTTQRWSRSGSFVLEQDSPFEAADCDLGPTRAGREAQLVAAPCRAGLRFCPAERVGDGPVDRHGVDIDDGLRRDAHVDLAALTLDLEHAPPAQLPLEPDVPRDRFELPALQAGPAALPAGGAHHD